MNLTMLALYFYLQKKIPLNIKRSALEDIHSFLCFFIMMKYTGHKIYNCNNLAVYNPVVLITWDMAKLNIYIH